MVANYGFPDTSRRTLMVTVAAVTFSDSWWKNCGFPGASVH